MSFHIRVSARGIVINNDKILLNEFGGGEYYNIPGGGVELGENIHYVPYIHEQLMEYIKTNSFSSVFIEEPLNRK